MPASASSKPFEPIPFDLPEPHWPVTLGLAPDSLPAFYESLMDPDRALYAFRNRADTPEPVRRARERMLIHALEGARHFSQYDCRLQLATVEELRAARELPYPQVERTYGTRYPTLASEIVATGESELDRMHWMGRRFDFGPPDPSSWRAVVRVLALAGGTPPDEAEAATRALGSDDLPSDVLRAAARSGRELADLLTPRGVAAVATRFAVRERLPFENFQRGGPFLAIFTRLLEALADTPGGDEMEFDFHAAPHESDSRHNAARIAHVRHPILGDFLIRTKHCGHGEGGESFQDFAARRMHFAAREGRLRPWTLVMPPDALLWAGPALAELARVMRELPGPPRSVIFPCRGGFMRLA